MCSHLRITDSKRPQCDKIARVRSLPFQGISKHPLSPALALSPHWVDLGTNSGPRTESLKETFNSGFAPVHKSPMLLCGVATSPKDGRLGGSHPSKNKRGGASRGILGSQGDVDAWHAQMDGYQKQVLTGELVGGKHLWLRSQLQVQFLRGWFLGPCFDRCWVLWHWYIPREFFLFFATSCFRASQVK